jgi:subtilase family serine protease
MRFIFMRRIQRFLTALIVAVTAFSALTLFAQSTPRKNLRGHVPGIVPRLQPLGRCPDTNNLYLAIGLPLRNREALANLLQELYDPASPNYRQYLTPEQFTEQFGPTESEYQTVIDFAKTNGLTVVATHGNRVLLDVSGPAANVEQTFHVKLNVYRHPTGNRTFYAPDTEPSVNATVPILDVSGLDNYRRPHPHLVAQSTSAVTGAVPKAGSGPSGQYFGGDFRAAYVPGVALRGSGQAVGLVEFDGYYLKDITNYEATAGFTNVPLQNVLIDGFSGTPTSDANAVAEVSLDIEMAIAMAPALARVVVFEGNPNNFIPNDVLNTMAASNSLKSLSCSWGWGGGPSDTTDGIFLQMAAQGQTFFNASGDSDAFTTGSSSANGVDNPSLPNAPSSSPYITQVGGTSLTTSGTNWSSETTWNAGGNTGSSGGISSFYAIPAWQLGVNMTTNQGSTNYRNIPDVALTGANIYVYYNNGSKSTFAGTSCAAPLWAGFIALVNQQAAASSQPPVGFINPALYAIAKSTNYLSNFHDITTGNNFRSGSTTKFAATNGYDLCTGWGTPRAALINSLAIPDVLAVVPGSGFYCLGQFHGPFTEAARTFTLTNTGASSLGWSLINTAAWLNVSASGGTLTPGGAAATVTAGLNATASNLWLGTYIANVVFTNQNSHIAQVRPFILVLQPALQNGGFETGDYSNWYVNGVLNSDGGDSNFLVSADMTINSGYPGYSSIPGTQFVHSGTYGTWLGQYTTTGTLSQTFTTVPQQPYLFSFWYENSDIGQGSTTTPNTFQALWGNNTVFSASNVGIFTWTNLHFIVTASSTSTIVQFKFRNDPGVFSLDDVTVAAIPAPAFAGLTKSNSTLQFAWSAVTGMVYQLQYRTNLLQTNWINLGSTITATNPVAVATNNIGPDPRRFYRVQLVY